MNWTVAIIFLAALGACIGSFINVVIFRVPENQSLIWPPSHCPKCNSQLKWWENVPVISWFYLGGQCRTCESKIHIQYPIVEAIGALMFVGMFIIYYSQDVAVALGHPYSVGPAKTWPIYAVHLFLLCALLAGTWIDAKLYIIPLEIPWLATLVALIGLPAFAWWQPASVPAMHIGMPLVSHWGVNMAVGGVAGLAIALLLLHWRILPRSFDDEEMHALEEQSLSAEAAKTQEDTPSAGAVALDTSSPDTLDTPESPDTPDAETASSLSQEQDGSELAAPQEDQVNPIELFLTYSHPRREVLKEGAFLLFPILGAALAMAMHLYPDNVDHPLVVKVLAGVVCGYLVGGGMVWITRVLGTLGFGKEAMGLGDVHLLGAIGAALGPKAVCLIFFIAPFLGLTYVAISVGVSRVMKGQVRVIPYGPYLAMATLIVMVAPGPVWNLLNQLLWSGNV